MHKIPSAIDSPYDSAILSLLPTSATEDIMAKKTTKKKPAAKAKKKAPAKKTERVEIELDPIEIKALELAQSAPKVRKELEEAATLAMSQAVREVFKQYGISLTRPQSQEVAAVLFGD
jgi:hypothetical protein